MKGTSTLTSKGQITIPIEVRRALKLTEGDKIQFEVKDGKAILEPQHEDNPFAEFVGIHRQNKGESVTTIVKDQRKTRGW